ncbi:MAG: glycosyltransferase family 4 protein [Hyphomicrobiaceae bacterium]|nr:MAG: glycosyltransferase family 4 protein [Hyphomicrobiaceae bacterium]
MRVWILNVGEELPSDPGTPRLLRAAILARELTRRGHHVTWWNSSVNHQQKIQRADRTTSLRTTDGLETVLLWGRLYRSNRSLARILSNFETAFAFLKEAQRREPPDVIIAGYPIIELAAAGVAFATRHRVPIAVDFRDMWPDIIDDELKGWRRVLAWPLLALWQLMKRSVVRRATAVVGVTQGFVDWALESTGVTAKDTTRVFHLAVDPFQPQPGLIDAAERYWNSLGLGNDTSSVVLAYAGAFSRRYDLATLVHAACRLPDDYKARLRLVLCGRGDMSEALQRLAKGETHILLPGWRSAAEIHVLLRRSQAGLLPYYSSRDYVCHFPNKVGEYLSAGLPIVTCLKGETQRLLSERGIGRFYDEGSIAGARKALMEAVDGRSALTAMSPAALQTYAELFDPKRIYPDYCRFVEQLAEAHGH